ncbi:hypothetical protein cand_012830 [Cryptosporidium andersoni]|uniref:glutathione transferase n=1 Tax=Cryptosporidium andersoni TaxID=117008 RepID=A0A1J4MHM4_9CRYT|nr:hypothetical protein cand_012830 [Cryptosporidium andersoni]
MNDSNYPYSVKSPLKLIYFACRGSCDVIRLLLNDKCIPYEEHNIQGKDFLQPEFQNVLLESDNFPILPYLSDPNSEMELTGSLTILRYLGRKCNLMGNNYEDELQIENWLEYLQLVLNILWEFDSNSDNFNNIQKNKKRGQFLLENLHPMLHNIQVRLDNGKKWIMEEYSVADIMLYTVVSAIIRSWGYEILQPYDK